jgi:hypothetical protein
MAKLSSQSRQRSKLQGILDRYLATVEQNDSRKIYRAKHVLSKIEGTRSMRRKIVTYFSDPWRPLRLCARYSGSCLRLCRARFFVVKCLRAGSLGPLESIYFYFVLPQDLVEIRSRRFREFSGVTRFTTAKF